MFRLVVLAAVLACALGAPRTLQRPRYAKQASRIVGGEDVAIELVPYQVSFEEFSRHICGASIISEHWVVTAAHCVEGSTPSGVRFRVGTDQRGEGGTLHNAAEIIANEQYDSFTIDYDVAVVRVNAKFKYDETTAAISLAETAPAAGVISVVSGWGTTSAGGSLPVQLKWVQVPIVDSVECNDAYVDYGGITDRMICAGLPEGGVDSCQGDSGGPLAVDNELAGVVSWGLGCAEPGYPGVYSNVATLRSWIVDNAQE